MDRISVFALWIEHICQAARANWWVETQLPSRVELLLLSFHFVILFKKTHIYIRVLVNVSQNAPFTSIKSGQAEFDFSLSAFGWSDLTLHMWWSENQTLWPETGAVVWHNARLNNGSYSWFACCSWMVKFLCTTHQPDFNLFIQRSTEVRSMAA